MSSILSKLLITTAICVFAACGGKDKKSSDPLTKDSSGTAPYDSLGPGNAEDSSLAPVKEFIEKGLTKWMRSFKGFSTDSFRMTQVRGYEASDNVDKPEDQKHYFEMYKASLVYSPDSSHFIDLYSANIWLEKKGKKILAIGDADQAVLLCNPKKSEWKRLIAFGPSAAIEEAIWTSTSTFILAGAISNDEGKWTPILLLGDVNKKSIRWFESDITRPESSSYEPSGMAKLKIDEWE